VADAKRIYANQFVHIFHDVLPEYEEKFLLHHVGKEREKLIISKEPVKVQIKEYQALTSKLKPTRPKEENNTLIY
jgi:hypothetical protein